MVSTLRDPTFEESYGEVRAFDWNRSPERPLTIQQDMGRIEVPQRKGVDILSVGSTGGIGQ
jgi:hypothetical protein